MGVGTWTQVRNLDVGTDADGTEECCLLSWPPWLAQLSLLCHAEQPNQGSKSFPWFKYGYWYCVQKYRSQLSPPHDCNPRVLAYRDPSCWCISIRAHGPSHPSFPIPEIFHSLSPQPGQFQSCAGHQVKAMIILPFSVSSNPFVSSLYYNYFFLNSFYCSV